MKRIMTNTIIAATILVSGAMASASQSPAWICSLNFSGVSKGIQLIVGFSEFKGRGTLSCTSAAGETAQYPIKIKMGATPIAPLIGIGYMELYGESLQIAISNGTPKALLGHYLVAQGHAAIVGGVGAITAVRATDKNLSFTVSLQLVKGLGVDLGFTQMKLELDPTRQ